MGSQLFWALTLSLMLIAVQFHQTDAALEVKIKKLLKKLVVLKLLSGKRTVSIIPLPIPFSLFNKAQGGMGGLPPTMERFVPHDINKPMIFPVEEQIPIDQLPKTPLQMDLDKIVPMPLYMYPNHEQSYHEPPPNNIAVDKEIPASSEIIMMLPPGFRHPS